ncbi:MAG: caspase family protein [Acidobacteriota bacterium]
MNSTTLQSTSWNEARSVHLGLNRIDDRVYRGLLPELRAAEQDALEMRTLADSLGCTTRLLTSEEATLETVIATFESTIERLVPGDFLLITYSGHGTTFRGLGDDPDGWDEGWCLYDGVLVDDELHDLLATIPQGVDVLTVTDACFAAGITDVGRAAPAVTPSTRPSQPVPAPTALLREIAGPMMMVKAPFTRLGDLEIGRLLRSGQIPTARAERIPERRPIQARLVSMAAAAEGSLAFEGDQLGYFTAALLMILHRIGDDEVEYGELMDEIASLLTIQQPTLAVIGGDFDVITSTRAFKQGSAVATKKELRGQGLGLLKAETENR